MASPGYNKVDVRIPLLSLEVPIHRHDYSRHIRTSNVRIVSLYCDVIPTFCTGVIILANIMLAVVNQTAKKPPK